VHGLAAPLGAIFPIPHGVVCASLLPSVIRHNAKKAARIGDSWLLTKYCAAAAQLVDMNQAETENDEETLEDMLTRPRITATPWPLRLPCANICAI